ncbi:MAG: putative 2OG-Fe(II) oxygenase [Cyanobacteriota bacterium]|nr:putative 2OG-Fe(II) oxygenase [Cyanobacteriota bacterium]
MSGEAVVGGGLRLRPLFALALAQVQLALDPLDVAEWVREILALRGEATGNPLEGCAWTGDLNGVDQLQHQPLFAPLLERVAAEAMGYVEALGFEQGRVALHVQRAWPVVSEAGQLIGRHHHPNAHLSGIVYLSGDGTGASGCLRLWPPARPNELVPGLAVGHGGPIAIESEGARQWNAPWWDVAPRAGLVVLFPASVEHAVMENGTADDWRVSIAIDFCLTAPAEEAEAEYLAPHPSRWLEVGRV